MPQKDSLHQMLTPPVSRQMWVISVVASLTSTALGIILLAGGDWIPGGILVAAVLVGRADRIPGLWRLYRERFGPSPPRGRSGH
jgi:hypothetical protein